MYWENDCFQGKLLVPTEEASLIMVRRLYSDIFAEWYHWFSLDVFQQTTQALTKINDAKFVVVFVIQEFTEFPLYREQQIKLLFNL